MLTQDQKQKFIACLEQKMKVKLVFQWEDFLYFQYIGCSETGGAAAYIAGAYGSDSHGKIAGSGRISDGTGQTKICISRQSPGGRYVVKTVWRICFSGAVLDIA